ncbi:zinc finger protein 862-like [Palaemon carinicauda]|uniref:zinc finger protein 862-like n=1 Tax=Palaemon carinicauda TaxID=392227 RepID=UPI0035B5DDFE
MALFIAEHTSVSTCGHLNSLCKACFTDSKIASMTSIKRSKCSAILKNVLYTHFMSDLKNSVGDNAFSLLIDESTDISINKYLGIAIIYHDEIRGQIMSTFLSLTKLEECNASGIVTALKETLHDFGLNIKNLKGLGTDNASVMVGVNNGVYEQMKVEVPNLVLVRCVCHSLQLAVSAAATETLPRNLDYIISETYNWFSRSSLRQAAYQKIYNLINENHDPLKIVQSCHTRWLSIATAVERIHDQWLELKTHFDIVRNKEKCFMAQMLYEMYNDGQNLAFVKFLLSVLKDIQRVNKAFESNESDPTKFLMTF